MLPEARPRAWVHFLSSHKSLALMSVTSLGSGGSTLGSGGSTEGPTDEDGARSRADWDRVDQIYQQCLEAVSDEAPFLPASLTGFLAELMSRVSASYYGQEDQLVSDALEVMAVEWSGEDRSTQLTNAYNDARFVSLPEYRREDGKRHRPTPFEAVVETARRLRDLNAVGDLLEDWTTGILGGSSSYGRYYNVQGPSTGTPSDSDVLLVLDSFEDLPRLPGTLGDLADVDLKSVELMNKRVDEFAALMQRESGSPFIFSTKIGLWADRADPVFQGADIRSAYSMSFHVTSREVFRQIVHAGAPKLLSEYLGQRAIVLDFRETAVNRKDHQRSFSGMNLRLNLKERPVGTSFVRESSVFYIDNLRRYFPGMFQNLILPGFETRWANDGAVERALEAFRWKVVERLRLERRERPNEFIRLSLSHTRSEAFAPHTVRSVDKSTVIS